MAKKKQVYLKVVCMINKANKAYYCVRLKGKPS